MQIQITEPSNPQYQIPKTRVAPPAEPQVRISTEGGMWVRQLHFLAAGDVHAGHLHSHDHVTLLAVGRLRVRVGMDVHEFTAPHIITIGKMKVHNLEALEAGTVAYCVAPIADVVTEPA